MQCLMNVHNIIRKLIPKPLDNRVVGAKNAPNRKIVWKLSQVGLRTISDCKSFNNNKKKIILIITHDPYAFACAHTRVR